MRDGSSNQRFHNMWFITCGYLRWSSKPHPSHPPQDPTSPSSLMSTSLTHVAPFMHTQRQHPPATRLWFMLGEEEYRPLLNYYAREPVSEEEWRDEPLGAICLLPGTQVITASDSRLCLPGEVPGSKFTLETPTASHEFECANSTEADIWVQGMQFMLQLRRADLVNSCAARMNSSMRLSGVERRELFSVFRGWRTMVSGDTSSSSVAAPSPITSPRGTPDPFFLHNPTPSSPTAASFRRIFLSVACGSPEACRPDTGNPNECLAHSNPSAIGLYSATWDHMTTQIPSMMRRRPPSLNLISRASTVGGARSCSPSNAGLGNPGKWEVTHRNSVTKPPTSPMPRPLAVVNKHESVDSGYLVPFQSTSEESGLWSESESTQKLEHLRSEYRSTVELLRATVKRERELQLRLNTCESECDKRMERVDTLQKLENIFIEQHKHMSEQLARQSRAVEVAQRQNVIAEQENAFLQSEVAHLHRCSDHLASQIDHEKGKLHVEKQKLDDIKLEYLFLLQSPMSLAQQTHRRNEFMGKFNEILSTLRHEYPSLPPLGSLGQPRGYVDMHGFLHRLERRAQVVPHLCAEMALLLEHCRPAFASLRLQFEDALLTLENSEEEFDFERVKKLCRQGTPHTLRGRLWRTVSRHLCLPIIRDKGPDYMEILLQEDADLHSLKVRLNRRMCGDLLQVLPSNVHFSSLLSTKVRQLQRVILALCVHDPELCYSRELCAVAAVALIFLEEQDAFWLLVAWTSRVYPPQYFHSPGVQAARADRAILLDLVRSYLPMLDVHCSRYGLNLGLLTEHWFLTFFCGLVPFHLLVRIFDSLLLEGSKAMFRISLAFLQVAGPSLVIETNQTAFKEKFDFMDKYYDVEGLMARAFQSLPNFPQRRAIIAKQAYYLNVMKDANRNARHPRTSGIKSVSEICKAEEKSSRRHQSPCKLMSQSVYVEPKSEETKSPLRKLSFVTTDKEKVFLVVHEQENSRVLESRLDLLKPLKTLFQSASRITSIASSLDMFLVICSEDARVAILNTLTKHEMWNAQFEAMARSSLLLPISALGQNHFTAAVGLVLGLANGELVHIQHVLQEKERKESRLKLGTVPVTQLRTSPSGDVLCACGNSLFLLNLLPVFRVRCFEYCSSDAKSLACLEVCPSLGGLVWILPSDSTRISLWSLTSFRRIVAFDLSEELMQHPLSHSASQQLTKKKRPRIHSYCHSNASSATSQKIRLTTMSFVDNKMLVGTSHGWIFVFEIQLGTFRWSESFSDDEDKQKQSQYNSGPEEGRSHRQSSSSSFMERRTFLPMSFSTGRLVDRSQQTPIKAQHPPSELSLVEKVSYYLEQLPLPVIHIQQHHVEVDDWDSQLQETFENGSISGQFEAAPQPQQLVQYESQSCVEVSIASSARSEMSDAADEEDSGCERLCSAEFAHMQQLQQHRQEVTDEPPCSYYLHPLGRHPVQHVLRKHDQKSGKQHTMMEEAEDDEDSATCTPTSRKKALSSNPDGEETSGAASRRATLTAASSFLSPFFPWLQTPTTPPPTTRPPAQTSTKLLPAQVRRLIWKGKVAELPILSFQSFQSTMKEDSGSGPHEFVRIFAEGPVCKNVTVQWTRGKADISLQCDE